MNALMTTGGGGQFCQRQTKFKSRKHTGTTPPPFDPSAIVHRLLRTVPDKYLRGLDCVVLMNLGGLSRRDRVGRVWSRNRRVDKSYILGRYHHSSRNSLPYIELRVDKIIEGLKGKFLWLPFLRELVFGHVLFHELGHHIHCTIRPEHQEKEDVADKWAGKLNANFIREQYWYALPIITPAAKIHTLMRRKQWI
ncbi:MAG: hypothetical protein LAO30_04840 [Acidobacteriia bacterium]|nr:hypothetical protein [Terriglobia bacterium]